MWCVCRTYLVYFSIFCANEEEMVNLFVEVKWRSRNYGQKHQPDKKHTDKTWSESWYAKELWLYHPCWLALHHPGLWPQQDCLTVWEYLWRWAHSEEIKQQSNNWVNAHKKTIIKLHIKSAQKCFYIWTWNMKSKNNFCLTLMSVQDTILPSDETEQKLWLPSKSSVCQRTWIKINCRVKYKY